MVTNHRKHIGNEGESLVIDYLKKHGFSIMACNYRTRQGEIDIIAQKGSLITFVEVKRRLKSYFNLSEVITPSKQRKIIQTAATYRAEKRLFGDFIFRFDVALVEQYGSEKTITYISDAFRIPEGNFL